MTSKFNRFFLLLPYFLVVWHICLTQFAHAQCSPLSKPTVKYTFGRGTTQFSTAQPSDFGFTTTYALERGQTHILTNDGEFSFVNLVSNPWNVWHDGITDHTGDGNGYMMLVNASYDAGEFYRDTVNGLCMGVQYEFSVWLGNVDDILGRIMPNVRFEIRDAYTGDLLADYETGDLPVRPVFTWERHAVEFDATTDRVVLLLINNNPGGLGNDLVLDDVAFTPCLPVYDVVGDSVLCIGENLDLQANLLASSYLTPEYQWQKKNAAGAWVNLTIANNLLTPSITEVDSGWYRLLVAEMGSMISGMHCRSLDSIYIDVIEPLSPGSISASQTICFNTVPTLFTSLVDAASASETIVYRWQTSTNLTSWNNANSSTGTFQETALRTSHHYRRQATTDCYTEYSNIISISVYDSLTNNTITSDQIVCDGATPTVTTISSPISGGQGTYAFQWYYSTDSLTWADLNTETGNNYQSPTILEDTYIRLTTQDSCGNRNSNVVKLDYQLTESPVAIEDTICVNSPLPTLEVSGTNIQWYDPANNPISPPTFTNTTIGTQRYFVSETILGCESEKVPISLTVLSKPVLTLTPQMGCEGDTVQFIPTVTGGGTIDFNYTWFTELGNPVSSSEVLEVVATTSTFFSLVVGDNSSCTDSTSATLTVHPNPILTLAPQAECEGDMAQFIPTVTDGTPDYNYAWFTALGDPVSSSETLELTAATSTFFSLVVSDNYSCSDSTSAALTVHPNPILTLASQAECEGGIAQFIPTVTGGTPDYNYAWFTALGDPVSSSETLELTAATSTLFSLVVSDNHSCSDSTSATLIVHSNPILTLAPQAECEGDIAQFIPTVTGGTPDYNYTWFTALGDPVSSSVTLELTAAASTLFSLVVSDNYSCTDSTSATLTVHSNPVLTLIPQTECEGDIVQFIPTVTGGTPDYNYAWFTELGSPVSSSEILELTAATSTLFSLVVSDNHSCSDSTSATLIVHSNPILTLAPQAECEGDIAQFIPTITGGTPDYNYAWFTELGNPVSSSETLELTAATSTFFSLVVSDNHSCSDSTSATLTVHSKPILSLTDTSICEGDTITISPTIINANGIINYNWMESSASVATTPTIEFHELSTTNYTLVIVDENSCKDTSEVTISINQAPIVALTDLSMCDGEEVTFTPTITSFTSGGTRSWFNASGILVSNANTLDFNGPTTTSFTFVFEDDNTCKDSANATVVVAPKPLLSLTDETICEDDVVTITPAIVNATGVITYRWTEVATAISQTTPTIQYIGTKSADFELIVADENNCKDTTTVQITVLEKPKITIDGKDVCSGNPSTLVATVSNYTSGLTYNWNPSTGLSNTSASTTSATPSSTTIYLLTVTTQANCVHTMSYTVGVTTTPTASILGSDTLLCEGESVIYTAYNDPTENYSTEWYYSEVDTSSFQFIQLQGALEVFAEGYYRILVRNKGFCAVWSDIIHVKTEDIAVSLSATSPFIYLGDIVSIEAKTTPDVLQILWSTGDSNIHIIDVAPEENTTYDIEVKGERCTARDQLFIEVFPPIIIPNGFSPNGDGKNERWFIKGISYYPNAVIKIFNRWGNIVYQYNSGYDEPWEGIDLNGTALPVATYYYVIEVNDKKNQKFDGSVSIVR